MLLNKEATHAAAWVVTSLATAASGVVLTIPELVGLVALVVVNVVAAILWLTGVRRDLNTHMAQIEIKMSAIEAGQNSAGALALKAAESANTAVAIAEKVASTQTAEFRVVLAEMRETARIEADSIARSCIDSALLSHVEQWHDGREP